MLIDMPEVVDSLSELRNDFECIDLKKLYSTYLERLNLIDEWKFSSGNYFHHEPYFDERGGYSSPVLVKRKYQNIDEARWLGKYCFGFIKGKHVLTVKPSHKNVQVVNATLYDEFDSTIEVRSVSFKFIVKSDEIQANLGGMNRIFSRPDNTKLDICVGLNGAFYVILFSYSKDGLPVRARLMSKGYPDEDTWDYHYSPDGKLEKITAGGALPLWTRGKKN